MKLVIHDLRQRKLNEPYLTINNSNKLAFNKSLIKKLKINDNSYFQVATEEGDGSAEYLYLIEAKPGDEHAKNVGRINSKNFVYYNLAVKSFVSKLDLNFEKYIVRFYYQETLKHEGKTVHKFFKKLEEIRKK